MLMVIIAGVAGFALVVGLGMVFAARGNEAPAATSNLPLGLPTEEMTQHTYAKPTEQGIHLTAGNPSYMYTTQERLPHGVMHL